MASPSPVPPYRRVVDLVDLAERLEQEGVVFGGDADPGVADLNRAPRAGSGPAAGAAALGPDGHLHRRPVRELDRVADQVDQHLPQPGVVEP